MDSRINFKEAIDNVTALKIQREVFLLVNPRKTENYISKITLPSKTFEYLISGTPALTTKLNSYTEEYNDLIFYSVYTFIKKHKNWDKQGAKIKKFIAN